ncbi:hypothetical protein OG21DRAFT_1499313 [Imleria badia]|nr:hypothetical protein OG21DRAFT_1499313 [Imleria badia]
MAVDCHIKATLATRRLTAASRLTNQSCINVLEPPAKKAKYVSGTKRTTRTMPLPQTPSQSMNSQTAHLYNPPSAGTSATTSTVSNLAPGRPKKAQLPKELIEDGGTDDVWSIARPSILLALPLLIDTHKELDSSTMDFSPQGPIVSIAYQRLCDWRHNIGSTAVAIIISFMQCADNDREIRDMADMLLDNLSFLYEDLDASSPKKAFRSNFLLQLLNAAHLQCVEGAMKSVVANALSLHGYCGIIGLCGAALERALRMASEGHITHKMVQALEGKNAIPKVPVKVNEQSGKESNMSYAFSDQNWGVATRSLTERVKKCTPDQITAIVNAARETIMTLSSGPKDETIGSSSTRNPNGLGTVNPNMQSDAQPSIPCLSVGRSNLIPSASIYSLPPSTDSFLGFSAGRPDLIPSASPLKPPPTDPKGWSSVFCEGDDFIRRMLGRTLGVPASHIHDVLEDQADHSRYIYSYKNPALPNSEVVFLFGRSGDETYRVESPCTQKELRDLLQYKDWNQRIVVKDLGDLFNDVPFSYLYYSD